MIVTMMVWLQRKAVDEFYAKLQSCRLNLNEFSAHCTAPKCNGEPNKSKWGPSVKYAKRSPWGPMTPNGDPLGSSAVDDDCQGKFV